MDNSFQKQFAFFLIERELKNLFGEVKVQQQFVEEQQNITTEELIQILKD